MPAVCSINWDGLLEEDPVANLVGILFTMRKRLCFETFSGLQEYLSPVATAR